MVKDNPRISTTFALCWQIMTSVGQRYISSNACMSVIFNVCIDTIEVIPGDWRDKGVGSRVKTEQVALVYSLGIQYCLYTNDAESFTYLNLNFTLKVDRNITFKHINFFTNSTSAREKEQVIAEQRKTLTQSITWWNGWLFLLVDLADLWCEWWSGIKTDDKLTRKRTPKTTQSQSSHEGPSSQSPVAAEDDFDFEENVKVTIFSASSSILIRSSWPVHGHGLNSHLWLSCPAQTSPSSGDTCTHVTAALLVWFYISTLVVDIYMIFGLVDAQYLPAHHFLRKATHKAAFFGFYLASYQFCVTLHGIMVCSIWSSWLIRGSSYIT